MPKTISIASGAMRALLSTSGARLLSLHYDNQPVILSADPEQHPGWFDVYPGALIGPVANRIRAGHVPLSGTTYQMVCNENDVTALHSGPNGLDVREWQIDAQTEHSVRLHHHLDDGDMGLPGKRHITVSFALDDAALTLDIKATTTTPTPMSIAHHPYWRLGNARDHKLQVSADHYLPTDADNVPTGTIASVDGTALDHRTARQLDAATDHNLCTATAPVTQPRAVATLTGTDGLRMVVETTEPGLQVYSGAHLPDLQRTDVAPFAGIALEPQGWPDAPNNPSFPNVIATPETPYHQITRYVFDRAT
ncbi:aldose epimerase family protein [uncultured Tateyamaria sp.]|uniref:aldose epimerase family protein n=1 Tax=uncultured Tateyamaria sp. TaxID=455651 RepID=UPI0026295B5A|nr:aldose epimerase family protein [uncultured Tateyamaria sp.]